MGILDTVKDVLEASTESPDRSGGRSESSEGAYWCHDCDERLLNVDVEGDGTPDCPDCGEAMEFERSVGSTGCAC